MGTFSGQALIDELAIRLRDTTNTGYPRATVLNILNRVQDAVNIRLGLVHAQTTFVTGPQAFYSTASIATDYAYPVQLYDENSRELDLIDFERLTQQDPKWSRLVGVRPEMYSVIGRELLVLTPIPKRATTLTMRYVKHPTALADATTPLWDLPDEHKPLVLDVTEGLLLMRSRDFKAISTVMERATRLLGLEDMFQMARKDTVGDQSGG